MIEDIKIRNIINKDHKFIYESLKFIYPNLDEINFKNKLAIIQQKKKSWILVAENYQKNIIGFIVTQNFNLIQFQNESLIISDFYIDHKYRKIKVADILFSELEKRAKSKDYNQIVVMCHISATTTQTFYTKNKFIYNKKLYVKQI